MKKFSILAIVFVLVLTACNRDKFVKKLVGSWKLQSYMFDGAEQTKYYDTTYRQYLLQINEDENYMETWTSYAFRADSLITADSVLVDTVNMIYNVTYDTIRFVDTTVTPHTLIGRWDLLNSEEDLQLRNDSAGGETRIYRILDLTKSNLNLKKGNEELHLKK